MTPVDQRIVYTAQMVDRARQHTEAGWSLAKTSALLGREFGVAPSRSTVHAWVNPTSAQGFRDRHRSKERARKVHKAPSKPRSTTPERALQRMRELYLRGVSLRAIGQVAACWWGEELTAAQVKARLGLRSGEVIARRVA